MKHKKMIAVLSAALLCAFLALCPACQKGGADSSSSGESVSAETVEFYLSEKAELQEYTTIELSYVLNGAEVSEIEWSSSAESVATVEGGFVTGISRGEAVITAEVRGVTRTCSVTVTKNDSFPVLVLSQTDAMPRVGGQVTVTAQIYFNGSYVDGFDGFIWTSSAESVATVDGGVIEGVSVGEATVTVSARYNGILLEESVAVTVVSV